jgi:tRNA threonylcarbamoyladenosine biosynthesis protein TsaB
MIVLGLDTSTLTSGIAVLDGARSLATGAHDASRRSADLLVAIDEVCRRAGVAPAQLEAIAVGAGPGSFTGLRIGLATAKGIAFATRRPLWLVSSLAALADDAHALAPAGDRARAVIAAVLDARRGEVFAACYRGGAALGAERVLAPAELAPWLAAEAGGDPLYVAGDALAAHRAALDPLAPRWLPLATPTGEAVARLALAGARRDELTGGAPTYIRPAEAEVRYPDGVPGALRRR